VNDSPSQEITSAANSVAVVTDVRGRKIGIRKPKLLDRMRLFEVVGAENAMNGPYLGVAMLAVWAVSIDGDLIPRATTKLAVEGIVQRLDDDGLDAVSEWIAENNIPKSVEETQAAIKNE
jgi:hypothetical protein